MHMAMQLPMNHAQTAVAGPPAVMGLPKVAGTEPRTPRMDMAYETVDHFVNSRRNSLDGVSYIKIPGGWVCAVAEKGKTRHHEPACSQFAPAIFRRHPGW